MVADQQDPAMDMKHGQLWMVERSEPTDLLFFRRMLGERPLIRHLILIITTGFTHLLWARWSATLLQVVYIPDLTSDLPILVVVSRSAIELFQFDRPN